MRIPPPLLRTLILALPALACSQPAANGLLCSDGNSCPSGFQCYPTSAMEKRCYDRPLLATCSPGAQVCEDFEGAFAGWNLVNNNDSTITVDTTRAHTGVQSLHTSVRWNDPSAPPPNNISQGQVTQTVSLAPDIYMRFFLYQTSIFPSDLEIAALLGNRGDYLGASLFLRSGILEMDAPTDKPDQITPEDLVRRGDQILPVNKWICLEWQVHVATMGMQRVWIDDQPQTKLDLPADTTLVAPASGEGTVVTAGLGVFTDMPPDFSSFDVWFDDITVSPQRIYCR